MTISARVLWAVVVLVGCKKTGVDPTAKLIELKDAMCKCKAGDTACASTVLEAQRKWASEAAKSAEPGGAAAQELAKKVEPIMADYTRCMTAAMTPVAAASPAPPPAPAPAAPAPATSAPATPAPAPAGNTLGDQLELAFVRFESDGVIAIFQVTNHSTSCTLEQLDYRGYAYDKAGAKIGGATGGGGIRLAPGKSMEREFRVNGKKDSTAEVVITGVKCTDGTKWEDSARAPFDRPMGGKK